MLLEGQWAQGSSNGNIVIHLGMRNDIAHDLPSLLPLGIDLLGCFFYLLIYGMMGICLYPAKVGDEL